MATGVKLQPRAEDLSAIYEASRDLAAQSDVASLLNTLLQRVSWLLGSSSTSVFLYDADRHEAEVAATVGGSVSVGMRFALNQGIVGRVVATGEPIVVDDYQTWEFRLPALAAHGVRAIMMVPMSTEGEMIGALGVSEYSTARRYTESDAQILSLFAAHAASALRSAQRLEKERDRASELLRENLERRNIEGALRRSEERYRSLVEDMNDVVFTVGFDGVVTYISPVVRQLTGHAPETLEGQPFSAFVHPEDLPAMRAALARVLEDRRDPVEFRVFTVGGETRWVRSSSRRQLEDGIAVGITGSLTDITERRRAELALQESETRYRKLVEFSPYAVAIHREGRLAFVNRAGARMVGAADADQVLGRSVLDFVHPDDREASRARIRRILDGSVPVEHAEIRLVRLDGTVADVEITVMPLMLEGAQCVQVVMQDVTERTRDAMERKRAAEEIRILNGALEQRVQERTAELAAANRELEAFGYSVAHDLRGPLRAIDGFSRLLLDEHGPLLDQAGRDWIDNIRASSHRMAQLIQALLSLSRITRNPIERQPTDLADVARAVATELRRSQPERQALFAIPEHVPVYGDPSMLRIVVENLLGNAWKYTGMHAAACIEFGSSMHGGEVVYYVRDDGAGFDMRYAEKLFVPFQRLHHASEFEGTGIGLATVERIVHRHGGRVWAESAVEKGATFFFTLAPARQG